MSSTEQRHQEHVPTHRGATRSSRPWSVLQHVAPEGPGLIATELESRGIDVHVSRMDRGDGLPRVRDIGGLIVLGGPMGLRDSETYPRLVAERDLVRDSVSVGIPVLGICLGAQILAAAAGAQVYRGPAPEVEVGSVTLTREGRGDPVLSAAGPDPTVLHWHEDGFELPRRGVRLASSATYPNQAFRLGSTAYGLQFHIELDQQLTTDLKDSLPASVVLDEELRAAIERTGGRVVGGFLARTAVNR